MPSLFGMNGGLKHARNASVLPSNYYAQTAIQLTIVMTWTLTDFRNYSWQPMNNKKIALTLYAKILVVVITNIWPLSPYDNAHVQT